VLFRDFFYSNAKGVKASKSYTVHHRNGELSQLIGVRLCDIGNNDQRND